MQGNVDITTNEKDINIVLGNERKHDVEFSDFAIGSVKYVHTDLNDLQRSYIRLGFHLSEIRDMLYYRQFGYLDFYNFCAANFGLDKSIVSRLIDVSSAFCLKKKGSPFKKSMYIDDKYKDYSYSQLCEMLPLSDGQRSLIKPNMTIKQIRDIKKDLRKKNVMNNTTEVGRVIIPIFSESVWCDLTNVIIKFFNGKGYDLKQRSFIGGVCKKFSFSFDEKDYEIIFRVKKSK